MVRRVATEDFEGFAVSSGSVLREKKDLVRLNLHRVKGGEKKQ